MTSRTTAVPALPTPTVGRVVLHVVARDDGTEVIRPAIVTGVQSNGALALHVLEATHQHICEYTSADVDGEGWRWPPRVG